MEKRLQLQEILKSLIDNQKVYFQPPENIRMEYPCIVYERDYAVTEYANNSPYAHTKRYQVTVIDKDPDSEIPDRVSNLPLCKFAQHFKADNLNHDVYNLYF